ncbi:carbohydrate kinase [Aliihoeflea aestuarii]|uniref:carbohydrate kinase family protein n=1 Tax=Aliihoeflea aestuarii TaxID=453840 RepID=UPI0020929749|nr:carbohydrate kinase family protein [Aliihoeflea aestuarii]MCO6390689.1 carbohydrate kinase [Aliihoeflea aestuarii]
MSANPKPAILAVGGAHIDRRGTVAGAYVDGASNPGTMREEVGGGAFNALRNACRLGAAGAILSVRGGDLTGQLVAEAISGAGITDLSATFLDRTTPSYTAILRADGELICGFADMALYETAFEKQLRRHPFRNTLPGADAVLTDANLSQGALERLAASVDQKPLFAIAISPAKVVRLKPVLAALSVLFMNRNEARALTGAEAGAPNEQLAQKLAQAGLKRAVITSGSAPLLILEHGHVTTSAPIVSSNVRDVTGAGDALAGVTISRLIGGLDLAEAVRHGIAAASLTVESDNVVADFSRADFERRLAEIQQTTGA